MTFFNVSKLFQLVLAIVLIGGAVDQAFALSAKDRRELEREVMKKCNRGPLTAAEGAPGTITGRSVMERPGDDIRKILRQMETTQMSAGAYATLAFQGARVGLADRVIDVCMSRARKMTSDKSGPLFQAGLEVWQAFVLAKRGDVEGGFASLEAAARFPAGELSENIQEAMPRARQALTVSLDDAGIAGLCKNSFSIKSVIARGFTVPIGLALKEQGDAALDAGDPEKALRRYYIGSVFRGGITRHGHKAFLGMVRSAAQLGAAPGTIEICLKQARRFFPFEGEAIAAVKGDVLLTAGRFDEALILFERIARSDPKSRAAHEGIVKAALELGETDHAAFHRRCAAREITPIGKCKPKVRLTEDHVAALKALCERNLAPGKNAFGPQVGTKIVKDPRWLFFVRGRIMMNREEYAAALRDFLLVASMVPDDPSTAIMLPRAAHLAGVSDDVVATCLSRGLKLGKKRAGIKARAADVYALRGQNEEAAALYQAALEQKPDLPRAHQGLADLYAREGDGEKANHHQKKADAAGEWQWGSATEDVSAQGELILRVICAGQLRSRKQQSLGFMARVMGFDQIINKNMRAVAEVMPFGEKMNLYGQTLLIKPKDGTTALKLARLAHKSGFPTKLVNRCFTFARKMYPNVPISPTLHGEALFERGAYAAAQKALVDAINIDPNFKRAHLALAKTYQALGKKADAARHQSKAASLK